MMQDLKSFQKTAKEPQFTEVEINLPFFALLLLFYNYILNTVMPI